jgi:DNA helicase-2/ATP-dependent DNA helicase PcrA
MLSIIANKLLNDPLNSILLITFTNKASKNIILKCFSSDQTRIVGGTFHGLANLFAKQNNIFWNICDEGKKRLIIKKIFNCKKDKLKLYELIDKISSSKSLWPIELSDEVQKYNSELEKYNLLDFDDMIYRIISLLPKLSLPKITHILVDELQDTSGPQLEMLKALQANLKCNIIGVSDDDQCIYEWRNARPENVQDFIKVFNCKILNMGYNFRSDRSIVVASSNLITHNKNRITKIIRPYKTSEGYIHEYQCQSPLSEISYVISKCKQNSGKRIAILYRNRTLKNHLEYELKKNNIKYTVNDALEISDRNAVKVIMSSLKVASSSGDIYDLEIASKALKGIGCVTIESLKKELKDRTLGELLRDKFHDPKNAKKFNSLISIISYFNNNKDKNLDSLVSYIERFFCSSFIYQDDMKLFIHDITKDYKINCCDIRELCNDLGLDGKEENQDKDALVELSTIHGWKGMQADVVIIPWCHMFLEYKQGRVIDTEAERRLFYVGITRAESKLYLSYTGKIPLFIGEMSL